MIRIGSEHKTGGYVEMNLQEFAENINKLLAKRPETASFDVITAIDDEGNGFNLVSFEPSVVKFVNKAVCPPGKVGMTNGVCVN